MARKGTYSKSFKLPDGTRKYIYGKTKQELEHKILEFQIQRGMGIDVTSRETFGEFALMWYNTYKKPKLAQKSRESLLNSLNKHLLPAFSGYRLRDISPIMVQMFFNKFEGKSLALSKKVYTAFSAIMKKAADNNLIVKSPCVDIELCGEETKEREALTAEETETLLTELRALPEEVDQRAWRFCLIASKTGARRGEILGMMWSDIDFTAGVWNVQHNLIWPRNTDKFISTDLKTKASRRTIPLPRSVLAMLREERSRATSLYVFHGQDGSPLSEATFNRTWRHAARHAPVDTTPHVLRHTYCTRLFETKQFDIKEIQYLMGHSSPETTLRIYAHYCKRQQFATTAEKLMLAM